MAGTERAAAGPSGCQDQTGVGFRRSDVLKDRPVPTVFHHGGFRFYFYSNEGNPREPLHIHVERGEAEAKLWLTPFVAVAESAGFSRHELTAVVRIVEARRQVIERAWHDHFG